MSIPIVTSIELESERETAIGPSSRWAGSLEDGRSILVIHINPWLVVQAVGGEALMFTKHDEPGMRLFGMMQATAGRLDWSLMKGGAA